MWAIRACSTLVFLRLGALALTSSAPIGAQLNSRGEVVVTGHASFFTQGGAPAKADTTPFRQNTNGSTPSGWVQIGTPPKWLLVIFDTGSDKLVAKTWETIAAELASVDQGVDGMVMPSKQIYDHGDSTTYLRHYINNSEGKKVPRQSTISYGSGTAITDDGQDTIKIGNRDLKNFTVMEITADSLQLLHTSSGIAGVLGLQHMKNKSLGRSLFSEMRDADLMSSFGYCRGTGNNGTFIWADDSTEGQELEVIGQMHWAMKLAHVSMPNASLPASLMAKRAKVRSPDDEIGDSSQDADDADDAEAEADAEADAEVVADIERKLKEFDDMANEIAGELMHDAKHDSVQLANTCPDDNGGGCTAILDSGSNIIAGPTAAMKSISNLANVKPDCSNYDDLPDIHMTLGGMKVTIPPSGYVMKVPMPETQQADEQSEDDEQSDEEGDAPAADQDDNGDDEAEEKPVHRHRHMPREVHLHRKAESMSLAEKDALTFRKKINRRWKGVFERLYKSKGVDLREIVHTLLTQDNSTNDKFMCMPALVPLDKKTFNGPLFIVGTPLLDAYYARWSFAKGDPSPKIHLKALEETQVCKDEKKGAESDPTVMMRSEKAAEVMKVGSHKRKRGPSERRPEEIVFPHWAKDLTEEIAYGV